MQKGTLVLISLAEAAPNFVDQTERLLLAVENSDEVLVTDEILEEAQKLRRLIERGGW